MSGGPITPASLRVINARFIADFADQMGMTPTWSDKIASFVPSTSALNTYGWLGELPQMREWVGPRLVHGLALREYTIRNKPYEATVGLKRAKLEDDDYVAEAMIVRGHGAAAKKLPDQLVAALIAAGTTTTGYDGQFFFDIDHPVSFDNSTLGTYSNYSSSGKALSAANFDIIWSTMAGYLRHDGQPMGVTPNLLIVPPALAGTAMTIVKADKNAAGADNIYKGWVDVLVIPELAAAPTAWYLVDTTKAIKPFIVQERKKPVIVSKTAVTDDNVFLFDEYLWGVDARYGAGYGPHFLAYKAVA